MADEIKVNLEELIKVQQSAYRDFTSILFESLTAKVEEQNKFIFELRKSLEFSQSELNDVKHDLTNCKKTIDAQDKVINENKLVISTLQNQVSRVEDHSRRKNIRITGVPEGNQENWEQTQRKVEKIIQENIKITDVKVQYAHRINSKNEVGPRPIIARLGHDTDRISLLRKFGALKGTNIYLNEDLSDQTMKKRNEKLQEFKKAKSEGKIAYFSEDKLIVKERTKSTTPSSPEMERQTVTKLISAFTPGQPSTSKNSTENAQNTSKSTKTSEIPVAPVDQSPISSTQSKKKGKNKKKNKEQEQEHEKEK